MPFTENKKPCFSASSNAKTMGFFFQNQLKKEMECSFS